MPEPIRKTVGVLTFEQFHGRKDIGSSRIRCYWPMRYWEEAEPFVMGKEYEAVIFQKAYWIEYASIYKGVKILDMCDADFLHWGYRIKQMCDLVDAVTTSTIALQQYMMKLTDKPVIYVPDRIDFNDFKNLKKEHIGNGPTKTATWYGYSENLPMLDSAINSLVELEFEQLNVVASKSMPYRLPSALEGKIRVVNYPWTAATWLGDIMKGDIVLNPQTQNGRWKYKSNNKTICAWACNLPVAHTKKELKALMTEESRVKEAEMRYTEVREKYDVKDTVNQYRELISSLR